MDERRLDNILELKLRSYNFSPLFLAMLPWWERMTDYYEDNIVAVHYKDYIIKIRKKTRTDALEFSFFENSNLKVKYETPNVKFEIYRRYKNRKFLGYYCELILSDFLSSNFEFSIVKALHNITFALALFPNYDKKQLGKPFFYDEPTYEKALLNREMSILAWMDTELIRSNYYHASINSETSRLLKSARTILGDSDGTVVYNTKVDYEEYRWLVKGSQTGYIHVIDNIAVIVTPTRVEIYPSDAKNYIVYDTLIRPRSRPAYSIIPKPIGAWTDLGLQRDYNNKNLPRRNSEIKPTATTEPLVDKIYLQRSNQQNKEKITLLTLKNKMKIANDFIEPYEQEENKLIFSQIEELYNSFEEQDDENRQRFDNILKAFNKKLEEQVDRPRQQKMYDQEITLKTLEVSLGVSNIDDKEG